MKVRGIILIVSDLAAAKAFYEGIGVVFGNSVTGVAEKGCIGDFWIELLSKDKVVTKAFVPDVAVSQKGAGQYVHLLVDSTDRYYKVLTAKGYKPLSEPQDFPWGHREFVIQDPDGYKIVFYELNITNDYEKA